MGGPQQQSVSSSCRRETGIRWGLDPSRRGSRAGSGVSFKTTPCRLMSYSWMISALAVAIHLQENSTKVALQGFSSVQHNNDLHFNHTSVQTNLIWEIQIIKTLTFKYFCKMRTNESLKEHRTKLVTWGKKKENPTATRIKDEFDKRNIGYQIIMQKKQPLSYIYSCRNFTSCSRWQV